MCKYKVKFLEKFKCKEKFEVIVTIERKFGYNNGEEMEEESRKLSTPVIELRVDRLLSNLRHNARAQSASVTRNKQGWAVYEVCVVAQSMGDPGQLAIKPETRCPVVDHAPWGYVSTRIGTVIVSFDHPSRVYPCTTSRKEIFVMKVAIG